MKKPKQKQTPLRHSRLGHPPCNLGEGANCKKKEGQMTQKLFVVVMVSFFTAIGFARDSFAAGAQVEKINESASFTDTLVPNPCDPSGNSDITASGVEKLSATIVTLPNGTINAVARISVTGKGTDSSGNTYKIGGFFTEHELQNDGEGDVSVLKATSSTGQAFVVLLRFAELKNNTIDRERTICLGN